MPIGLGGQFACPITLGGGDSASEIERDALLDALSPILSTDEGSENYAECDAEGRAIACIWAINERIQNQAIPARMLEALPTWEEACRTRPALGDRDIDRRARVASKLRGLAGNALPDIESACRAVLGSNFVQVIKVDAADVVAYWPGVNPGPPGFEWASNRAIICVQMNKDGLSNNDFIAKRASVVGLLDALLPAWMSFGVGVGSSFVCNQGVLGQTLI